MSSAQGGRRRRFSQIKKELGLVFPSRGSLGDRFLCPRRPNVVVKKYKVGNPEKTTQAIVSIQYHVEEYIRTCETLSDKVELLPVLEVGRDFVVKELFTLGTHVEDIEEGVPEKERVHWLLNKLHNEIKKIRDSRPTIALKVLENTLRWGSRHVFWSFRYKKFIIPDLVITEENLKESTDFRKSD